MSKIVTVYIGIGISILVLAILYFFFVFDIGLNSKYFVRRDFTTAFLARKTGNCDLFKKYIATDLEKWGERCIREKDLEGAAVQGFSIKEITVAGNSAFLQVELKRDLYQLRIAGVLSEKDASALPESYTVNYDMKKEKVGHLPFPRSRWLIQNELR